MRRAKRESRLLLLSQCPSGIIAAIVFRGDTRIEHLFLARSPGELASNQRFRRVLGQVTLVACMADEANCLPIIGDRRTVSTDSLSSHMLWVAELVCKEYERLVTSVLPALYQRKG